MLHRKDAKTQENITAPVPNPPLTGFYYALLPSLCQLLSLPS